MEYKGLPYLMDFIACKKTPGKRSEVTNSQLVEAERAQVR